MGDGRFAEEISGAPTERELRARHDDAVAAAAAAATAATAAAPAAFLVVILVAVHADFLF